jgi:flagellar hook-length control protein FliK
VEDATAIAHTAGNKLVTDSKSRGAPDITPSPPSTPRPSTPSTPTAAIEPAQPAGPSNSAADPAAPAAPPWPAHATLMPQPAANNAAPANASVNAAPSFEGRLAAALDSPAFAPALATQVSWLASEGVQHARLNLNPLEMGPLAVKIVLDGTQARIDFTADMAGTRAAIEASLPTLAAALNDNGLTLAGGGVFDGQARQGAHGGHSPRGSQLPGQQAAAATLAAGTDVAGSLPARVARGLVDLIA